MKKSSSGSSYKFYNMGSRGLEHDVKCGSKVVIPAGMKNVRIAFRQSHLTRFDEDLQKWVNLNVYLVHQPGVGMRMYHA